VNAGNSNGGNGGGGMYNNGSSPVLTNVTISLNTVNVPNNYGGSGQSGNGGGGMYNNGSSPVLTNVTISGNTVSVPNNYGDDKNGSNGGGGMFNGGSYPVLVNVLISGNKADCGDGSFGNKGGGGMHNHINDSTPVLINVTIAGNAAVGTQARGGGIFDDGGNIIIRNSIIWGNTAAGNPNSKYDGNTPTIVNSNDGGSDPLFVTTSIPTAPSIEGDYSLQSGSPAINQGLDSYYPASADDTSVFPASLSVEAKAAIDAALLKDLGGVNNRFNGTIDMGAYELP
jgi:hypothetical protein